MAKQYVLVSQGIEIYRTECEKEAKQMMEDMNKDYYDYLETIDYETEAPVDNEVFLYEED